MSEKEESNFEREAPCYLRKSNVIINVFSQHEILLLPDRFSSSTVISCVRQKDLSHFSFLAVCTLWWTHLQTVEAKTAQRHQNSDRGTKGK